MPFMAGLNGEEGPHAHRNPVHGIENSPEAGFTTSTPSSPRVLRAGVEPMYWVEWLSFFHIG
jgi:hypothetical protein